jgi:uncharacterized protein
MSVDLDRDNKNGTDMNTLKVIHRLREHQRELRERGVLGLSLFGSVARGEPSSNDIDLAAEFDRQLSILGLVSIEDRLCELLGAHVDLCDKSMLKEFVRQHAEFIHVF